MNSTVSVSAEGIYYIPFDRNANGQAEARMAEALYSAADHLNARLYVDFYAVPNEINKRELNQFVDIDLTKAKRNWVSRLLSFDKVSAYVCLEINSPDHLKDVWTDFVYSNPKMYRVSEVPTARNAALDSSLIEDFQYVPMQKLNRLLTNNICVFRDCHDEVGLEFICCKDVIGEVLLSIKRALRWS